MIQYNKIKENPGFIKKIAKHRAKLTMIHSLIDFIMLIMHKIFKIETKNQRAYSLILWIMPYNKIIKAFGELLKFPVFLRINLINKHLVILYLCMKEITTIPIQNHRRFLASNKQNDLFSLQYMIKLRKNMIILIYGFINLTLNNNLQKCIKLRIKIRLKNKNEYLNKLYDFSIFF